MSISWEDRLANRMGGVTSSAIRELFKPAQQPGMISFAGGMPARDLLPTDAVREASIRVLNERGPQALQYGSTEGYLPLRRWILEHLTDEGIRLTEDNIIITTGAQQGLDLTGKLLLNPGDKVIVESPTFLGALQAFNAYQAVYESIPMDENGMQVELLYDSLAKNPGFIYTVPNFQNPSGVTLSLRRRHTLVEMASRYDVPILEDDPYDQLRFEGERLPTLLSLDAAQSESDNGQPYQGNVIRVGSFSKILGPGLRLGWAIGAAPLIRRMVQAKQGVDLHTSLYVQMVVHEVVEEGFFEQHIARLRAAYRERRNIILEAMTMYFPPDVRWTMPQGGLFIWVILPPLLDSDTLLDEALHNKVAFVPGAPFYADRVGSHSLRLSFSYPPMDQIELGIQRLGEVLMQAGEMSTSVVEE
ncbi:MAG: aminotransferase class I/II-fold pyridoxal phosphate-dependent enzyme [Anaerolineales bacterium]|nr:aminotransferase class I/II-fold pyridoxal phosphate-dependent enzyme [Anaerolineales bacterium]